MNIDAIIEQLGGTSQVQILLGVGPSAVSNYRVRGNFPEYARVKVWQALKARGIHVNPETLELIGRPAENTPSTLGTPMSATMPAPMPMPPSILLIISGGIAAYKALELIRRMKDKGWHVRVILTKGGAEFITPLSVSALSGEKTYTDLFSLTDEAEMGHITLARSADLLVVAPATAHIIARIAHGMTDDLATTAALASDAPLLIAPAMNPFMWANPATTDNVKLLRARGVRFVGPDSGDMACGEDGPGRLADPMAIIEMAEGILPHHGNNSLPLKGKHIVVTSGPTHEAIDGVRYLANKSSGKQGHAIASSLIRHGATVELISGPVQLDPPVGAKVTHVTTAKEMLAASKAALPADVMICAAAVADWAVAGAEGKKSKLKKAGLKQSGGEGPALSLIENPDILATISTSPNRPRLVVGFAAETENVVGYGDDKRRSKGCDWILANDVGGDAPVFGADDNQVHFITKDGAVAWPRMSKAEVADQLAAAIIKEFAHD